MKNNILKIILLLAFVTLLIAGGIFAYKKYYPNITLPENNFDATGTVPNTNISFKYPSEGFYGLGVNFLGHGLEPGYDPTQVKGIGFKYKTSKDPTKVSEYIVFNIGFVTEKGNVDGYYTLENAVRSIKKIYDIRDIDSGEYKVFNNNKFYIYRTDNGSGLEGLSAYFLQDDGVYKVSINYLKPINSFYGKDSDTPESRVAYKNNDKLFLEILKNIELK